MLISSSDRIRSLQVLRAFAACAVVYTHAFNRIDIVWGSHPLVAQWFAMRGTSGIDLFFLLSGFLMAHLHADQFGTGVALKFLRRRILRIVPLYWALTALAMAMLIAPPHLFATTHQIGWPWALGNFLFLPIPQPSGLMAHAIVVGWTLDYEMYFYALFALAMRLRRGLACLAVFLLGSVLAGALIEPTHPWTTLLTSPMLLEFLGGIGIARLFAREAISARVGWFALSVGIVLLSINPLPLDFYERVWKVGVPCALILIGCLGIGFPCQGPVGKRLVTIGDASYSIYLFQGFALPVLAFALSLMGLGHLPPNLLILLLWITGCAAGIVCWALVERPINRWLRSRTMSPPIQAREIC